MPDRKPDFSRLKKVLTRDGEPDCLPFYELFADPEIVHVVTGKPPGLSSHVEFQHKMGYDYASAGVAFGYPQNWITVGDTAGLSRGQRSFIDNNNGMIQDRAGFDAYPWPALPENAAVHVNELTGILPAGMKAIVAMPGGVLENVMWLMGYIPFSYAIQDDEQLVYDMFGRIGADFTKALDRCLSQADLSRVGAVVMGDDMGFKTSVMISPGLMRKYVFPWQKKLVDVAHDYGLPFILHACGNLELIMDELIDYVGIDAKHSYEDIIQPVAEVKKRYGHRLAILGGVDMHFLSSQSAEQVREYTRRVIAQCAPGGGYALGTGNTVSNYVPLVNYYAMLDAGRDWRY